MKAMQCELCGGTDIVKEDDFFCVSKLRDEVYSRKR